MADSEEPLLGDVQSPPVYESATAPAVAAAPPPRRTATTTTAPPPPKKKLLPRPPPLSIPVLNLLRTKRIVLASSSPRRRQILSLLGLPNIEIIPPNTAEDFSKTLSPFEYVLATATEKAQSIYAQETDSDREPGLIIAADTVVVDAARGTILEKPRSEAHHLAMLKALRDSRDQTVYTAVVVMAPLASARDPGYAMETAVEETAVRFDGDVTDDLIVAYVRTREGVDKAGGYALQGLGSILIESIEGSYDNVVGLPLKVTLKLMEKVVARADDEDRLGEEDDIPEESDEE